MLALYPIFNFKGFKYNPDLLQLVTLPLLVLAYLNAFEKRSVTIRHLARPCRRAGADDQILGADHDRRHRACRADPSRRGCSSCVASAVGCDRNAGGGDDPAFGLAEAGGFRAADLCRRHLRPRAARRSFSSCSAMSAIISRCWHCRWRWPRWRWRWCRLGSAAPAAPVASSRAPGARANSGVNRSQALNVWIIQIVVAIGPPLGALVFEIYIKTDWGISLFFLVPLALVAIPALRVQRDGAVQHHRDLARAQLATLVASPWIAAREMAANAGNAPTYGARSELARELTQAWHARFNSRWAAVAGTMEIDPADGVLQSRSSGAVHAGRNLDLRADVARGSQAARLHRRVRSRPTEGCRSSRPGWRRMRRTPSAW